MADGAPASPDRSTTTLVVSGPLTLAETPRWRDALSSALAGEGGGVRVDLAASGPWDLAGVQLLIAAMTSGRLRGREVRLVRVPGVFREITRRAGLGGLFDGHTEGEPG